MKKTYLFFLPLFFSTFIFAQNIVFEDENFKDDLIYEYVADLTGDGEYNSSVDTNFDGEISIEEAEAVKGIQILSGYFDSVNELTYFTNIKIIEFDTVDVNSMNLTGCDALESLILTNISGLENLSLPQSTSFKKMILKGNSISIDTIDFSYNTSLKHLEIDSNNFPLEELDITQNVLLEFLKLEGDKIETSVLDLTQNVNLKHLSIRGDEIEITELDLTQNTLLEYLHLLDLNITELDLTQNTLINDLYLWDLDITELDLTQNTLIVDLFIEKIMVSELDLTQNILLENLFLGVYISDSSPNSFFHLTELNLSQNTQLKKLDLYRIRDLESLDLTQNTLLTNLKLYEVYNLNYLDLTQNTMLKDLNINGADISELDLTQNILLEKLWFNASLFNNTLSELDLTQNTQLNDLILERLDIIELDLTQNILLNRLSLKRIDIEELDVSQNILLEKLFLDLTQNITSLNLNQNVNLKKLNTFYHNQIKNLYIKNINFTHENFINSELEYLCVDENKIDYYQEKLLDKNNTTCIVDSFCAYNPLEETYKVKGEVNFSYTSDCENEGEAIPNFKFEITDGENTGVYISDQDGNHSIYLNEGTYTIIPKNENSEYFIFSPESIEVTFPNDNNSETIIQDFCLQPNGEIDELEISIIPIDIARPGFDADYKIVYKNIGNTILSGEINFNYDDLVLDFVSTNPIYESNFTGNLTWSFENLLPFEKGEIFITLNLNSPQEDPALNSGSILPYTVIGSFALDSDSPQTVSHEIEQEVVNSYDPNDKTCLEGKVIDEELIGDYIHYRIRFENEGTASAVNVVIEDDLNPEMFDVSTLELIDYSHSCEVRVEGNKATFLFQNIFLPFDDANNDGYVVFKIKTLDTLELEDIIKNTAEIFFDFNDAIVTNTEQTHVGILDINSFEQNQKIELYPNPGKNLIKVESEFELEKLEIFNLLGESIIAEELEQINEYSLKVNELKSGIYFISISTAYGTKMIKWIKE
ncbi:T9SS type A sorting domain-containing protein [Aureivirga sp. CE67]|uniref:T9SS type A sorting domain-containing protein n=1 Tax=Aureivirga sp. CE67 TaxID=1788983 RepID=UPI0018CB06B2|nr:T9SS type A sorting domain-containing protein [Aureivirga sp. CE67]